MFGLLHRFLCRIFQENTVDTLLLRFWCLIKIKLIAFVRVRIVQADEVAVITEVPLNYRTRNHLGSMYMGSLVIGAETGPVFYAIKLTELHRIAVTAQYSAIKGDFLSKTHSHKVVFICRDTARIKQALLKAQSSDERFFETITVDAYDLGLQSIQTDTPKIASFSFTLTMRRKRAN